ncbi:ATPase family AAA domain-containing protein 2-like [Ctenocephalides felis]|uniref:ATPase family AAA domain-containing protein 2-like n=1 Tax=Ctenocephalides felis TaxID=7515 RepID=UPI000E6E3973|nr:ATPase family AAA domain-containing protein 2-like [Ctenocephalides felis]
MSEDSDDQRALGRSRKRRRDVLDFESDSSDYARRNSDRISRRVQQHSRVNGAVRKNLRPRTNTNYRDIISPKIGQLRRYSSRAVEDEEVDDDDDDDDDDDVEVVVNYRNSRYERRSRHYNNDVRQQRNSTRRSEQEQNDANNSGGIRTRSRSSPNKSSQKDETSQNKKASSMDILDQSNPRASYNNNADTRSQFPNGTSTPEPGRKDSPQLEDEMEDEEGERQSSSDDVRGGRIYELRQRKPLRSYRSHRDYNKYDIWSNAEPEPKRRRRCLRATRQRIRDLSDDDDDEEDDRAQTPYIRPPVACSSPAKHKDKLKPANDMDTSHIKLSDIQPLSIGDDGFRFEQVGGLDSHVRCLREMVILPMLYPEVFAQFGTKPPKGVLFHGPPGTGKTLLARALAGECSANTGQKVSFFLRKGGDLLNKWFGESEKHLRLLFEQAQLMRPSIIFFDEIDGFCPARTSKQDQVYSSIVSTLLTLMDGLEARGDVIIIGATNRIESLDPALRRPGRFDRELFFPLPARSQREAILKIHVSKWKNGAPGDDMISQLSDLTDGYCGADLEALCSEAMLQSLRRTYPQIYESKFKLAIDTEKVKVEHVDFLRAQAQIIPAGSRKGNKYGRRLPRFLLPLLDAALKDAVERLGKVFPYMDPDTSKQVQVLRQDHALFHSRLLILGQSEGCGQSYLAPALLHHMEHLSVYNLDVSSIHGTDDLSLSQEQTVSHMLDECMRRAPSILYLPSLDLLWEHASDATKAILAEKIQIITKCSPVLVLATANMMLEELDDRIQTLFPAHLRCVLPMTNHPMRQSREEFFKPLFVNLALKPPQVKPKTRKVEVLPRAPTPPARIYTPEELAKFESQEEEKLVELRVFLREIAHHLSKQRTFRMFAKPVDLDEVKDYLDVIKQPMDLETMIAKIDLNRYTTAKEFLQDIDLICANALEYNPNKTSADKKIRHCAVALKDYAYAKIKGEMDTDFEDECQEIAKRRMIRNQIQEAGAREAEAKVVVTDPNNKTNASNANTSKQSNNSNISMEIVDDFFRCI